MKKRVPPATEAFRILTATLLSLILPLSFLLLARVCVARYLRISAATHNHHDSFHLSSIFFLFTEHPIILQLLVSLITVSCLAHSLTEFVFAASIPSLEPFERFHLHIAWILLSFFHIFVGLGVEGSIAAGVSGCGFGQQRSFVCRVVFFLGLHKEMMFWSRMVVRPVVDDTFFGFSKGEGWADKVAMGLSLGGLWWWSLREEVEAVVVLPEIMGVGAVGFVWWWLYCSTASIGVVMVAKGCISTVGVIFRRTDASEGESRPVHIPWKLQIEPV
ncbi:hypothetical protein F511_02647 [Dorcoceras hygrometricum]|uniref:Uncharacterized protein n=1 Tax=Dorcoceras hygrometricum TaxID=472368 RepID=A0A2Z7AN94_9LAMI|nr:hypothetical protein F511_02647 [Dorcoceras hygrometricum]